MATDIYSDGTSTYDTRYVGHPDRADAASVSAYRDPAGTAFVWLAWAVAFAFWALSMGTFFGILAALRQGGPATILGGVDAGGVGFMLMGLVGGLVVLGAALAWGMARSATRDKRRDPLTEAATAELYDSVERAGGDDMVSRSPEARRPDERASYPRV